MLLYVDTLSIPHNCRYMVPIKHCPLWAQLWSPRRVVDARLCCVVVVLVETRAAIRYSNSVIQFRQHCLFTSSRSRATISYPTSHIAALTAALSFRISFSLTQTRLSPNLNAPRILTTTSKHGQRQTRSFEGSLRRRFWHVQSLMFFHAQAQQGGGQYDASE